MEQPTYSNKIIEYTFNSTRENTILTLSLKCAKYSLTTITKENFTLSSN